VFDSGEKLNVVCQHRIDENNQPRLDEDLFFALYYTSALPNAKPQMVGRCPFNNGCNTASFYYSGVSFHDGHFHPVCLLTTEWVSRDYGANDKSRTGINPWTQAKEDGDILDHAISIFDANYQNMTKISRRFKYRIPPPIEPIAFYCPTNQPFPIPRPEGEALSDLRVDPPLGPETDAFFDAVQDIFKHCAARRSHARGLFPAM
jgi:hypothetical protein